MTYLVSFFFFYELQYFSVKLIWFVEIIIKPFFLIGHFNTICMKKTCKNKFIEQKKSMVLHLFLFCLFFRKNTMTTMKKVMMRTVCVFCYCLKFEPFVQSLYNHVQSFSVLLSFKLTALDINIKCVTGENFMTSTVQAQTWL